MHKSIYWYFNFFHKVATVMKKNPNQLILPIMISLFFTITVFHWLCGELGFVSYFLLAVAVSNSLPLLLET